ncbi:MAG: hypothetical protein H7Y42_08715 [Chitinophagaceae bacterium]|nr:hypothetical protein [Chitinophagaceae bacterium]
MKPFLLILQCLICIAKSYGQVANSYGHIVLEITKEKVKLSTKVEIKSAFSGGDSSWVQSLEKHINQSIRAGKPLKKGKYIVSVVFILAKDGSLSDTRCEKDPGFGVCEKVILAIKKSEKWVPAEPVKVREYRVTH